MSDIDEYELVLETGDLLIIRSNKYKVKQYMCNYDIILLAHLNPGGV